MTRPSIVMLALLAILAAYGAMAYVVIPAFWTERDARRPPGSSWVTHTAQGIAGDPVNIALIGSEGSVIHAMRAAGWFPADPLTLDTGIGIVGSVLFDRPYRDAPVSPLFLDGRAQDLAFEKPVGSSAERRQHVRLWRSGREGAGPPWLGAVTFDDGVGVSRYTGAITHDIAPDVDAARSALAADLRGAGVVAESSMVEAIGATREGRNGEGDPYVTDGKAEILTLRDGAGIEAATGP